jgi:hypothetical protein
MPAEAAERLFLSDELNCTGLDLLALGRTELKNDVPLAPPAHRGMKSRISAVARTSSPATT